MVVTRNNDKFNITRSYRLKLALLKDNFSILQQLASN
jgi:hypothetical protein